MRVLLSLLVCLSLFSLSYGQNRLTDSSVIIDYRNVFSFKCMQDIASEYGIHIVPNAIGCYGPQYWPDKVDSQNHRAGIFYENRLGKDWLEKITKEIRVCETNTCNMDSVNQYSDNTIGVPLNLRFQFGADSLNEHHLCVLRNSTLYHLQHSKTVKIAVGSHAAVGEEESSETRGQHLMHFLISNGIEPERIVFTEYCSTYLQLQSMPAHPMNCRIIIQVVQY